MSNWEEKQAQTTLQAMQELSKSIDNYNYCITYLEEQETDTASDLLKVLKELNLKVGKLRHELIFSYPSQIGFESLHERTIQFSNLLNQFYTIMNDIQASSALLQDQIGMHVLLNEIVRLKNEQQQRTTMDADKAL